MEAISFNSREAAEQYLRGHGFAFMGAPDRWRLIKSDETTYARISQQSDSWIVTIGSPKRR